MSDNYITSILKQERGNNIARSDDLRPEQLARMGVSYLEEAVLDVLYEVVHGENAQERWLSTAKISQRLGIPASGSGYPLVRSILDKLWSEARVRRPSLDRGGARYQLTKEEVEKRYHQ